MKKVTLTLAIPIAMSITEQITPLSEAEVYARCPGALETLCEGRLARARGEHQSGTPFTQLNTIASSATAATGYISNPFDFGVSK
ncbi:hypothetical protein Nhal_2267 [Nitrosococcus halophilus Nc 4]|uniref:Uncharacterized protein n=1 Tax=Nitrosococcus halophilus (strain Nc4) TaxID=472759 RepID=D5BV05_NITHN|nr:hypothetical protein [Nitrosococcus halophilus]ADE15355.1 hypothetical protein Nhal_2267 [Nitrosococcus halophilus Nc 4]